MSANPCTEAGALLRRASALGVVQTDAARDYVARVVPIVEAASDEEVRWRFLPGLLEGLNRFSAEELATVPAIKPPLLKLTDPDASDDTLRSAIANVFRALAGLQTTEGN